MSAPQTGLTDRAAGSEAGSGCDQATGGHEAAARLGAAQVGKLGGETRGPM
jgi:hypothetical protein